MLTELQKLKNAQTNLERASSTMMEHIASTLEESPTQITEIHSETSKDTLNDNLQEGVTKIIVPLRKVKTLVKNDNLEDIDLEELQNEMLQIHDNIQTLKETTQLPLHTLKQQEKRLNEELALFEKKMHDWDRAINQNYKKRKVIRPKSETEPDVCEEVKIFMDFILMSGGHENGWSMEDHNLFMRMRAKIKDIKALAEGLHRMLPDISEELIIAHEEWYQTYLDLNYKRKIAIHQWRNEKIEEMHLKQQEVQAMERQQRIVREMEEEEKKKKIREWQEIKRQKLHMEYRLQLADEINRKIEQETNKMRNEELKKAVRAWRANRNAVIEQEQRKLEMMIPHENKEIKATIANKLIKKFQQMDKQMTEQRKFMCRRKKTAALEPPFSSTKTTRDPERLLKPTKQWLRRIHKGDQEQFGSKTQYPQKIPKLGIPGWRKLLRAL